METHRVFFMIINCATWKCRPDNWWNTQTLTIRRGLYVCGGRTTAGLNPEPHSETQSSRWNPLLRRDLCTQRCRRMSQRIARSPRESLRRRVAAWNQRFSPSLEELRGRRREPSLAPPVKRQTVNILTQTNTSLTSHGIRLTLPAQNRTLALQQAKKKKKCIWDPPCEQSHTNVHVFALQKKKKKRLRKTESASRSLAQRWHKNEK